MIAKAKAISHGINAIRYITGESQYKKHPEKIYRVLDNLLPSQPDTMGIWNSMQLTLSRFRPIKNSVIRIELSPSAEHTRFFNVETATALAGFVAEFDKQVIIGKDGKAALVRPIWQTANTRFGCILNPKAVFHTFMLRFAVWMKMVTSTTTITFIFVRNVQLNE